MNPSDALINKSDAFWDLGVATFSSSTLAESTRLDVTANRLYYGMFLAVCAYASKYRGLKIEERNPNVHRVAKALVQAIAGTHQEFIALLPAYERLETIRGEADYKCWHVNSTDLTSDAVIKPANKIRMAFIAAAKDCSDQFQDVEFDFTKVP